MSRLVATSVSFAYGGGPRVLAGVDLALEPGTVTAIVGPNGAGKTTLLRILAGLLPARGGRVTLSGRPLSDIRRRELAREIAIAKASAEIPFAWTALDVALMGRAPHLRVGSLESKSDHARALASLTDVGADHLAERVFFELSAGEQQRVLVARALCQETPVLLLDEPTSHQDPAQALRFAALLRELAATGRTVACVLHDLNLAARVSDRIVFIADAGVVAEGPPAETLTPEVVRRVFGVESRRVPVDPPALVLGDFGVEDFGVNDFGVDSRRVPADLSLADERG